MFVILLTSSYDRAIPVLDESPTEMHTYTLAKICRNYSTIAVYSYKYRNENEQTANNYNMNETHKHSVE